MSKGLEALNRIGNMPTQNGMGLVMINALHDYDIIEKELKEKEELAQALSIITCENGDLLKCKRALAIIKEMLDSDLTKKLNANSIKIFKDIFDNLSKEKQDLLKEVLL